MEGQLEVLAEISVGLAGFSSIVVIFRRRAGDGAWKPEDVFRFKIMLQGGLVAGLFAVLPAAVQGLGVASERIWPLLSGLLLAYLVGDSFQKFRQFARLPAGSLSRGLASVAAVMGWAAAGVQALNVGGWLIPQGPGPYLFGVTWLTIYSGMTFYRLVTAPIEESQASEVD